MPAQTAHRRSTTTSTTQQDLEVAMHLKRAFKLALPPGLLIAIVMAIAQVSPGLLTSWLPPRVPVADAVLIAMALMGLACGLIVGLSLRGAAFLIRFAIAVSAFLLSWLGFALTRGIALSLMLHNSLIVIGETQSMTQIGLGILSVLVGALVMQRFQPQSAPVAPVQQTVERPRRARRQPTPRGATASGHSAPRRPPEAAPSPPSNGRVRVESKARLNQRQSKRQRGAIHLSKNVVQVCPYCLEEVKPRDPRGRVVCKICHTAHHADCWAISGRCQVPHLQP